MTASAMPERPVNDDGLKPILAGGVAGVKGAGAKVPGAIT